TRSAARSATVTCATHSTGLIETGCCPDTTSSRSRPSACPPRSSSIRSTIPPWRELRANALTARKFLTPIFVATRVRVTGGGAKEGPAKTALKCPSALYLHGRSGCRLTAFTGVGIKSARTTRATDRQYGPVSKEHVRQV